MAFRRPKWPMVETKYYHQILLELSSSQAHQSHLDHHHH
jgi:hypothetical protein